MSNLAEQLQPAPASAGCRLVATDGRTLPLVSTRLTVDVEGGLGRTVLEQRFTNPHQEPLRVTYQLPLPAQGAVSGFAFVLAGERIEGVVEPKQKARDRFERAVLSGHTAALLEQERSSLFTQEVGNLPPGEALTVEVTVDQTLAWLPDGAWEWRFPTVVAPRYLGGRVEEPAKVTVAIADAPLKATAHLALRVRDTLPAGQAPTSPTHAIATAIGAQGFEVTLDAEGGAALDRDLAVRWPVATQEPGVEVCLGRPATAAHAYGLVTIVPPTPAARFATTPRDLIVLLDVSGSMSGSPLEQAKAVVRALLDGLTPADRFELVAFSSYPERWSKGPKEGTPKHLANARDWLGKLRASGGTEMKSGIIEALAPLRKDAQRQVVLVTDGLIGSEAEIVEEISRRLPPSSRVHVVGVGSGVNRSLTMPCARAGRGLELVLGLGEDAGAAARRLVSRCDAPVLTEVQLEGSALVEVAPVNTPDVYAGAPLLASVRLKPEGGEVRIRAKSAQGPYTRVLEIPAVRHGEGQAAIAALFAREKVEDLELEIATGEPKSAKESEIERLGVELQIATRLTSWVAVSRGQTVDPREPTRHVTQPHELAHGLSAEGVGLRPVMATPLMVGAAAPTGFVQQASMGAPPAAPRAQGFGGGAFEKAKKAVPSRMRAAEPTPMKEEASRDERAAEPPMESEAAEDADDAKSYDAPSPAPVATSMPSPKRPAAPGLADRLRRAVKDLTGGKKRDANAPKDEGAPPPAPPASAAPMPPPPPAIRAKRSLVATVVTRDGQRLVVRFTLSGGALQWRPTIAVVWFTDGTYLTVNVDPAQSTKAGTLTDGVQAIASLHLGSPWNEKGIARVQLDGAEPVMLTF